ncbi:MAG: carbohydrate kinase [Flavobacteriaceae bacterium]|nr:carbohydrate kinase [Flavobacteriaceae bacterium]MCY4266907.1 carbohydrate kinase [Flavobacteriaceae bacterium]MCY4298354.1 carbohydrate kinase [Flavobacteriaceae bacterium]
MSFDSTTSKPIVCYGEILYDVFPDKKLIGGAPFNVAQRIHSLNYPSILVSRVGNDSDGKQALSFLQKQKIPIDFIQQDKNHPTGKVKVILDRGNPIYHILKGVAWDYIECFNDLDQLVSRSKALIFGSLSSRYPQSRQTLSKLISFAKNSVFDVNLRDPYYDQQLIKDLIEKTNFLKCNDLELEILCRYYSITSRELKGQMKELINKTNLEHVCVTLGSSGAILYFNQRFYSDDGFPVKVVDTVGAGDSFLGTLIHGLYTHSDPQPQQVLEKANAMGAIVASKSGASPAIDQNEVNQLIDSRSK